MNLSVYQQNFSKALSIVSRAVSSRTTLPVLSNILLDAKGDTLRLAATNREISITCWIGAKVEDEGAITIPARLLNEFVNSLPPERIDIDMVERTQALRLKCERFSATIKGIDYNEFPLLPTLAGQPDDVQRINLDAATLATMINGVVVAASDDENRPTLTGVEVTIGGGQITMAATDGYRLGYRRKDATVDTDAVTVVVPHQALEVLAKHLPDAGGSVDVVFSHSDGKLLYDKLLFGWAGSEKAGYQRCEMSCSLIDAKFPQWNATVPKTVDTTINIDTKALANAIKLALLFGRDNANMVRFDAGEGLKVSATSAEMGATENVIGCEVDGPGIAITFNGRFVQDALNTIDDEQTVIEFTTATRPALFYGGSMAKDDGFAVLMPMHAPK